MTWTYGPPGDSSLWALRFTIGDTASGDQQCSDEELLYLLTASGSVHGAAIRACVSLEAKAGADGIDKRVGDLQISGSQLAANYRSIRRGLERQMSLAAVPSAGGISIAEKQATEAETDRTTPSFRRGMSDTPGMSQPGGRAGDQDDDDLI